MFRFSAVVMYGDIILPGSASASLGEGCLFFLTAFCLGIILIVDQAVLVGKAPHVLRRPLCSHFQMKNWVIDIMHTCSYHHPHQVS